MSLPDLIAAFRRLYPDGMLRVDLIEHSPQPEGFIILRCVALGIKNGAGHGPQGEAFGFATNDTVQDYVQIAQEQAIRSALTLLGIGLESAADGTAGSREPRRPIPPEDQRPESVVPPQGTVVMPPPSQQPRAQAQATTSYLSPNTQPGASGTVAATQGESQPTPTRSGASGASRPYSSAGGDSGGRPVLPATEAQLKAIFAIARGARGMGDAEVEARCKELYGVVPSGLSRRQASEFIDALKVAPTS